MYGLSAMTGIIAPVVVAGVSVKMVKELFPSSKKRKGLRPSHKKLRKAGLSFGSFYNVGF